MNKLLHLWKVQKKKGVKVALITAARPFTPLNVGVSTSSVFCSIVLIFAIKMITPDPRSVRWSLFTALHWTSLQKNLTKKIKLCGAAAKP